MSNQLTSEQRYAIYLRQPKGWKKNAIAEEIGVHPSTVGRELKRNRCASGEYVWLSAQRKAIVPFIVTSSLKPMQRYTLISDNILVFNMATTGFDYL